MGCINKNLKDNQRLIQDFSETRVNQLFDEYFPNENPSYGEFISNPNVKEALGIIPISKVKSEIGKAFGKEISSRELKILKKSISDINDKLLGHSYKLFNIKQKGESDNYSWGLRKINSNINIQAKIDRLKQRINTGKQIRNLEDNQFNFPDINQTIKPGVEELFNENPKLANSVYAALGFKSKPDVILPIGTSGSGKSTFIKSLPQENLVVIEPDAMRVEFTGDMNNKSKDKEIYVEAAKRAAEAIKNGKQVVFDTTNLTKDKRLPFIEAIKKEIPNANIQYKLMELNPELAKQRIKADIAAGKNRADVPDATIDRHAESYKQMLEDIKNEPISNYEITPQQKQQATFMFSEFLDVYLQDFEQVERVLKEENVIEKDCTGGIKAENGLQTNFTRGGEWKLIKDLKGYPTHKEGGVDLTIGKNGVTIKNGDTQFIAKHGLVIPKN